MTTGSNIDQPTRRTDVADNCGHTTINTPADNWEEKQLPLSSEDTLEIYFSHDLNLDFA